jgi:hypothetical protein
MQTHQTQPDHLALLKNLKNLRLNFSFEFLKERDDKQRLLDSEDFARTNSSDGGGVKRKASIEGALRMHYPFNERLPHVERVSGVVHWRVQS